MTKRLSVKICYFAVITAAVILSGCSVGPQYSRPATAVDTAGSYFQRTEHTEDANDIADANSWWQRFGDPVTMRLVREALSNNYDIKAAAARVLQAQAVLTEMKGRQLPDVTYNFNRSRGKTSFNFDGGRFSNLSTTFTQDITISYVLDIFGKLKHAKRAAWADMLATKADEQTVINSMVAGVIKARVTIATLQRQLAIARANTDNREKILQIVERRYSRGLVGPVDVRLARENLAASKAVEPGIELMLITAHLGLDVLLGRRPGSSAELPETLADLPDLEPVPVGLPAWLLDRRPDVIAAELALKAANERIGVSIAQLYPDLTLTGRLGRSADRWRDIWKHEAEIYSAVMRVAQPIFKGGQLRAQINASKARYEELAAAYAGTVLIAAKEVEDALVSERLLQIQLKYVELQLLEALAAEELAGQRYQRGVEEILTVFESQRRRRAAENELSILKGRIWTTRVDLFLALGGDWS